MTETTIAVRPRISSASQRTRRVVRIFSNSARTSLIKTPPRRSARGRPPRGSPPPRGARAARPRPRPRPPPRAPAERQRSSPAATRVASSPARASRSRSSSACGERTTVPPTARAVRASSGSCAISRPRWMIATSSASRATSASTWLEMNTVPPAAANERRKSRSQRIPSGSRPFAGSSSTSRPGAPRSAAATLRRWRMASE